MNLAVHGILADGVGSGAGSFPILLRELLERGHRVDFFGIRGYTEPRSLEAFSNYRFVPLRLEWFRKARLTFRSFSRYSSALEAQLSHFGFQREAVRRIEARQPEARYDVIVCTDAQALWPSSLPILCWPQSPPNSEASALRSRDVARVAIQCQGIGHYAAVQLFYAYRQLVARSALHVPDIFLCGSRWARDEWARFGAREERLRALAYPIDLESFARATPLGTKSDAEVTFLWLGRATPRKRLDLFLEAFELLHRREPRVRARLVGNLSDALATRLLAPYRGHPAVRVDGALPRSEVPELLSDVHVLVQPSQNENFGFSVAEALAAGRAIVVGPTNGTADYLGEAGFLFGEYRPESVAAAMERAFEAVVQRGPLLSARAGEAAREHFSIKRVADRFLALCAEALARRTGPM
jgi:glycosyltransferase involved in cell wall biosynthesis